MFNKIITKPISPKKLLLFGVFTTVAYLLVTLATTYNLYVETNRLFVDQLRKDILSLAISHADDIIATDVQQLIVPEDYQKPEYARVVAELFSIKSARPDIAYAYVLSIDPQDPNKVLQPADADSLNPYANTDNNPNNDVDANADGVIDPTGEDELIYPGYVYEDAPLENIRSAYQAPYVDSEFYEDSWGRFISAYAPIKDAEGNTVAVLALDVRDTDLQRLQDAIFQPFVAMLIILCGCVLVLSYLLFRVWIPQYKHAFELDQKKDMLISMIGHELQTPVAAIRWVLSDILEMPEDSMKKEVRDMVSDAHARTVSTSELTKTILYVSRSELGKLDLKFTDVSILDVTDKLISEFSFMIKDKSLTVTSDVPADLVCQIDPNYFAVALKNLISNAIKYTPKDGSIKVSAYKDGDLARITVADTGIGIPEGDRDKLLSVFSRASNSTMISGHGLGLYLTKKIVEAHRGTIDFDSELGKGTRFMITIPLKYESTKKEVALLF